MQLLANPLSRCNLKFASNEKGEFEGYASVFNSDDAVNDTILPGAFSKSLSSGGAAMFINHDHKQIPVGTWKSLREDEKGLVAVGAINMDHVMGPSAYSAMKRGDMTGLSIGFTMEKGDFERKSGGGRIIKNASLKEVSIVTFPCEEKAQITAVKMDDLLTIRDLEHMLRDEFGCSKSVATNFLSHAKRIISGDQIGADQQIRELKQRLEAVQLKSLLTTLNKLGN
jgi:hypothetical protein